MPTYRAAPCLTCYAPAKTFKNAVAALEFARNAADGFRVGYSVYRLQQGNLLRLWTYLPADRQA